MITIMKPTSWKVVQKPSEIKAERGKWLSMERVINVELSRVNAKYRIRNLIRRPDGSFDFEAETEFDEKDESEIRQIFALLEQPETDFVQAKFYLPRVLQKRMKRAAVDLGVPVSSLVAAILNKYSRETDEYVQEDTTG